MGASSPAIVITLANDKGGVGRSTIVATLAVALARAGLSVATLDLDGHQRALTRWLAWREAAASRNGVSLAMPAHIAIAPSVFDSVSLNEERDFAAVAEAVESLDAHADVIIVDTPGGGGFLALLAMRLADVLLTPVLDSPVDVEALLGKIEDSASFSALVEEARRERRNAVDGSIDWIVVPNRRVGDGDGTAVALEAAAGGCGFRVVHGLADRMVYASLFADGLAASDATEDAPVHRELRLVRARVAAREEIEALIGALYLPFVMPGMKATSRILPFPGTSRTG